MNRNQEFIPLVSAQDHLQARFLPLLPAIEKHAYFHFRHVRCSDRKADALAEVVALCWLWFLRLAEKGTDANNFPTALASYATRAVRSGRRLTGQESVKDVMSGLAPRRRGFVISFQEGGRGLAGDDFEEALRDNTRTPVPDQVAFRCDWPEWLRTRTDRDRRIITSMALSERTKDISQKFGLSPSRISQLRRAYQLDWNRFCEAGSTDSAF